MTAWLSLSPEGCSWVAIRVKRKPPTRRPPTSLNSVRSATTVPPLQRAASRVTVPGRDDEQERRSRPLLPDETDTLRRAARPVAHHSLGRISAAVDTRRRPEAPLLP